MILFLTQGMYDDASSRVRIYNYFSYLEADEFKFDFISYRHYRAQNLFNRGINFFKKRTFTLRILFSFLFHSIIDDVDQVVVQRVKINKVLLSIFKYRKVRLVFDADDGVFLDLKTMTIDKDYITYLNKFDKCIFCSDLFDLDSLNTSLSIIPSCVSVPKMNEKIASDALLLVWIGSSSTEKYLETLRAPLTLILAHNSNVNLHVMGVTNFEIDSPRFKSIKWSIAAEQTLLEASDIGIMPLPKDKWTSFKCGYKLLLYMTYGKIAIGTEWGANKKIIQDNYNGRLVLDHQEWYNVLQDTIDNFSKLTYLGQNAREQVSLYYSYQSNYPKWKQAIIGQ